MAHRVRYSNKQVVYSGWQGKKRVRSGALVLVVESYR